MNFEGPLYAPLRVMLRETWCVDYLKYHAVRSKYFNMTTKQMRDLAKSHQGLIWVLGKILVPRRLEVEVISRYHDSPAAGHWRVSRTTSMVKLNYVFRNMRRNVRTHVRSCDVSQR